MIEKFLIFFTFFVLSHALVPCDNYWSYIQGGGNEGVQGMITYVPGQGTEHIFKILLSVGSKLPSVSKKRRKKLHKILQKNRVLNSSYIKFSFLFFFKNPIKFRLAKRRLSQ